MKFKRLLSIICVISIILSMSVISNAWEDDTSAMGSDDEEAVVVLEENADPDEDPSEADDSVFDNLSEESITVVYSRVANLLNDFGDSETMTSGDIIEGVVNIFDEETGIKLDVNYITQRIEQDYDLEGRDISVSFFDEFLGAIYENIETTYGQDAVEKLRNSNILNLFAKLYIIPGLAATGQCGENVYWTFDEATGALTISGEGYMWGSFINEESIKSVTIESGVTDIGYSAFSGCTNLKSVTIPDSVTYISSYAFYDCDITGELLIPSSVETIGYQAFEKNRNLETLTISEGVRTIGENAFALCESLKSVTIPWSVIYLNYGAFYGCSSITDVYYNSIEESWNNLGGTEYFGLDMDKVTIHYNNSNPSGKCGDNVNWMFDIETGALTISGEGEMYNYSYDSNPYYGPFYNNSSIKSVTIESGVTSIGDYAFYGCSSLTSVTIPDSVTTIGSAAFHDCSSLTSIEIPDSVTSIGDGAFACCSSLTSIGIPDSVTSIGGWAFAWCSSLTSITIPDSVTSIGIDAFEDCSSLTSITIPDSVTSIGVDAFWGCSSLTSVEIPDSVTSIGGWAFAYCSSLTSVEIPDSVTSIGNYAFYECSSLTSITVDNNNNNYSSDSFGVLYNKDKTELIQYPIGNERTSFTIPDSVTSIGEAAFYYCSNLTSVTIGNSVTSIGEYAFEDCSSLTSVTIGNSVTSIGNGAFYNCCSLTSIEIPDSVTSIGGWAFAECFSLTSVTIGNSVTSIGSTAFYDCSSLTSVMIPESVTNIHEYAFYGCPDDMVIFGVPGSYAQTYAEENDIMFVAVDGSPYVTIHCQPLTDTPDFAVYGVANPNTEISIYDGETLLATAKSDSRGQWKTTVTLNNPANNSDHTIKAVVTKNEESKSASAVVTYDVGAIFPVDFTLTHSGNTINLLTSKTKNLTIVPSNNFVFNVKLNKNVSSLKVTSTKDGVTKSITATYDSATGCWVASGWFDPSNHSYAPGELGLEIDGAKVPVECAKINYLIDPSGYVYEAVKSNRVEGASAIICYQDGENAIPWDANPFEQENPQITDEMGAYHWDVTEGMWRIKVTKSGYEAAYSDWMQVPPEWTEVAIPLVTTQSPEVKSVEKGEDGYIITFSQYMDIDSVNSSNVVFENNDGTIAGTITPVNKEVSGTDSSVYYASVFKFVPTDANAQVNAATINNVKNYAGITISETFTQEFGGSTPEHDHIPGQAVKEKEVSPSCTARGSYDEVVYCTVCGTELGRETKYVNALDHTAGEWMVTVQPTLTSEGTKELYCAICGATMRTESIPKLTQQDLKVKSVSIGDISLGYKSSAVITPKIDAVDGAKYDVTYSSSNPSAVSVDNSGRVTSKKTFGFTPGSAVITVTVTDSNGNTFTETCTVTVQFSAIQWIIKIVLFGWIWY